MDKLSKEKIKELENQIVSQMKTVYDPEIPVDIYELGLIYKVEVAENGVAHVVMTLTTPNCPVADSLPLEVQQKALDVEGIEDVNLELTFDPPWNESMASEIAQLQLGLL
jgi:FeS assembly SUF system protein